METNRPQKRKKTMETKITYMTYSGVCNLKYKIMDFMDSSDDAESLENILAFARSELESLEVIAIRAVFERRESRLAMDIEEAVSRLTKAVQPYLSRPSKSRGDEITDLEEEVYFFSERVRSIKEYDAADSSRIGSGGGQRKSKMVGISHECNDLASTAALAWGSFNEASVNIAISGMAGIGKTALAKEFFDDRLGLGINFDCRAWVEVGRKPEFEEIIRSILHQVNPHSDQMLMQGDGNMSDYLKDSLKGRKYLIVLDDVWDKSVITKMDCLLPNNSEESLVLLTTRQQDIAATFDRFNIIKMELLDEDKSWDLLREKVFGEEECPFNLEGPGKKIAEHCDGLPLTIVKVAELLSKPDQRTPQYWDEVAAKKNHQLFDDAYEEMSEVLLPSYENLTQILQLCFLYMGVFPQNYKIPRSKLITMWCTDGLPERNIDNFSNDDARECLDNLDSNSVVVIYQSTMCKSLQHYKTEIKTCRLHSSFWHLSNKEAGKIKFSCVLNSLNDGLEDVIKEQRRLSFHNKILLGIKDVYELVEDNCAFTAHSLLFYGPYHQYQVPVCFSLMGLRQLDALTIRFYEFPMEILQLVQLRYLTVTVNGKLPGSISQLSNLQVLIVGRHMSIKFYRAPSYLPVEIWNMNELQHLQVMGCDLPDPPCGTSLERLSTLSNVSSLSCSEDILKAISNLKKLGIRIELVPDDDGKPLSCFDHIFLLERLKSLKCVVENPELAVPLAPLTIFPSCLEKLSLSGLGCSWEEMSKLSSLPRLAVLKLRNYAFRGPKWEVKERGFNSLCSLVIEDTDLEEWKIGSESFPELKFLSIKRCYKLKKILGEFEEKVNKIELTDCNPLGVDHMENSLHASAEVILNVSFSWE